MHRLIAGTVLALLCAHPSGAQPLLANVSRSLSPDDAIIVVGRETGETRGVFIAASSTSLVMSVGGQRQEIPASEIVSIDKRGDPVWGGGIIGGAILGLGFMGGAGASCSPNCNREVPVAAAGGAAIGFGIGATIDYLHRGRTRLYTAPRATRPSPPIADAAAAFETLWERVKPGDGVSIKLTDGRDVEGRFARASAAGVTVGTHSGAQEFSAGDVQRIVRKRGGQHALRGVLIGAPLGALFGSGRCYRIDTVMHPADGGMSCGAAVLIGMGAGAAVGAAVGKTVWRRTVVYEAPGGAAESGGDPPRHASALGWHVSPIVSRHGIGFAGALSRR